MGRRDEGDGDRDRRRRRAPDDGDSAPPPRKKREREPPPPEEKEPRRPKRRAGEKEPDGRRAAQGAADEDLEAAQGEKPKAAKKTAPKDDAATTKGDAKAATKGTAKDAPKVARKDASKDVPKDGPKDGPKDAPKESPKVVPKDAPKESPKVAPKDAPSEAPKGTERAEKAPAAGEDRKRHRGPTAAAEDPAADDEGGVPAPGSAPAGAGGSRRGSSSGSESSADSRKRRRASLKAAMGFSAPSEAPGASEGQLALLPEKVRGLLDGRANIASDMARMRMFMEAGKGAEKPAKTPREEGTETVLRMPSRLVECLLHADNVPRLVELTGVARCTRSEEGHVVVRAYSKKGLTKALGQLRRIAFHCQWGCTKEKISQLLEGRPAKPLNAVLVRMAATSSRLLSHETKLTQKAPKLRIGTQGGGGSTTFQVEGIPGLSRRHCTVTFEPEKGACYIQDLSTNGTYLNGKRLPRPPFKNPQDARVRLFHGDEVFFRLRSEDAEELGFVVNLMPLS